MNRLSNIILIIFAYLFELMNRLWKHEFHKRFVIFHTGKLGDLVCVTPLFRAIKESFPDYEVILYARKQFIAILHGNPYLDRVIGYTEQDLSSFRWIIQQARLLRKNRPEYFVNLTSSFEGNAFGVIAGARERKGLFTRYDSRLQKTMRHLIEPVEFQYDQLLKLFYLVMVKPWGVNSTDERNHLFFEGDLKEADDYFRFHGVSENDLVVGVSVSSGKEFKRWPLDYWIELLVMMLREFEARVVLFGVEAERGDVEFVRERILMDKSNRRPLSIFDPDRVMIVIGVALSNLPYYIQRCNLFVSVDTGTLYIADALGVPVVNILGSCDEECQRPENIYRLVTNRAQCPATLKTPAIPLSEQDYEDIDRCFESITVDQVFEACLQTLDKR